MIENLQEIYGIERERDLDRLGSFFLFWGGGGGGDMLWYKPFCLLLVCWSSCTKCTVQYTTLTITYDVIYTTAFFFFCTFSWFVHFFSFISSLFSFIIIFFGGGEGSFLVCLRSSSLLAFHENTKSCTRKREEMGGHSGGTRSVRTHLGDTVHIRLTWNPQRQVRGLPNTSAGAEFLWRGQVLIATTCWHHLEPGLGACPCGRTSLPDLAKDDRRCRHSWSLGPVLGIFTDKMKRKENDDRGEIETRSHAKTSRSWDAAETPQRCQDTLAAAACFIHVSFVSFAFLSCFIRFICFIHVSFGRSVSSRRVWGWGKIFAMEGGKRGKKGGKRGGKVPAPIWPPYPRRSARATGAFSDEKLAGSSSSKSMLFFPFISFPCFLFFFLCFFSIFFYAFLFFMVFSSFFLPFFILFFLFFSISIYLPLSVSVVFLYVSWFNFWFFSLRFFLSFSFFILFFLSIWSRLPFFSFCLPPPFSLFHYIFHGAFLFYVFHLNLFFPILFSSFWFSPIYSSSMLQTGVDVPVTVYSTFQQEKKV